MTPEPRRAAGDVDRETSGPGASEAPEGDQIAGFRDGTVVAAVVRRGDAVLLGRRPVHKRHGAMWEFPGGKVAPGESTGEAIARELREELDVAVVRVGGTLYVADDPASGLRIRFVEVEIRGAPRPLEHEELRWVETRRAATLPLAPADLEFAREVLSD